MRDIYLRKNFRQPKGCRFFAARSVKYPAIVLIIGTLSLL